MKTAQMNISDIANQMIPLTYFRRNAGEVLEKLTDLGQLIIIKDGKPVATLTSVSPTIQSSINWSKFLEKVRLSRSFVGKRGNLSAVIANDRQNH